MSVTDHKCANKGFTLLELMIVIAIVAVLSTLAFPSFSRLILKHRAQDAASGIFSALFKARSEALRRVDKIFLQPNSGTSWAVGWKIRDNAGNILDTHEAVEKVTITFSGGSPIVYNSAGRISSATPITFVMTASNGNYSCAYTVEVDTTGRPYETSAKNSGTAQTAGGGAPSC